MICTKCGADMRYVQATETTVPHYDCRQCERQAVDISSPEYLQSIQRAFAYFDKHPEQFQDALRSVANRIIRQTSIDDATDDSENSDSHKK